MAHEADNNSRFVSNTPSQRTPCNPYVEFSRKDLEQSIASRFEQMAEHYSSRIAVRIGDQALTYDALNRWANHIAHALLAYADHREQNVAVLARNSLPTIATILGIAKAGKIYVPLDLSFSANWAQFILRDTNAGVILGEAKDMALAESWAGSRHNLVEIESLGSAGDERNPQVAVSPTALSQILYTSGTTGQPKGVMDTHRNILHYVMRLGNLSHVSPEDRMTLVRPPSSAGALSNLYLGILSGAAIFPLDLREMSLQSIADWLRREKVSIFHASVNVFRHLVQQMTGSEKFPDLRLIRLGSGQLFSQDVELFKRHFPNALLLHVLSSTETNTYRVHWLTKESQISEGTVPVGYPVQDMEVFILDESGKPVGVNAIGEIAVRSDFIFPGYWNNPALTASVFVNNESGGDRTTFRTGDLGRLHSDGCLEHLGRKDFQLKIRGHRVQAEEVEIAVRRLPGVSQAAVTASPDSFGNDRLVAYVTFVAENVSTTNQLRMGLRQSVPEHMMPSQFVILDRLPLTSSGKIDRQKLPAPNIDRPELDTQFKPPASLVETVIARIWSGALKITSVGSYDSFFDLGGDSLISTRIVSTISRIFPWTLTLAEFYDAATVAQTAELLVQKAPNFERAEKVASLYLAVEAMSAIEVETMLTEERNRRGTAQRVSAPEKE